MIKTEAKHMDKLVDAYTAATDEEQMEHAHQEIIDMEKKNDNLKWY